MQDFNQLNKLKANKSVFQKTQENDDLNMSTCQNLHHNASLSILLEEDHI